MKRLFSALLVITIVLTVFCLSVSADERSYNRPADLPYGDVLFTEEFNTTPAGKTYGSTTAEVIDLNDTEDGCVRLGGRWDDNFYFVLDGTEKFKDNVIISLDCFTPSAPNGLIYGLTLFKSNNEGMTGANSGLDFLWCENQGATPVTRPGNDQSTQFGDLTGKSPNTDPHNFTAMIANGTVKLFYDGAYLNEYKLSDLTIDDYAIGACVYATWLDLDRLQIWSVKSDDEPSTPTSDFTVAGIIVVTVALSVGAVVSSKKRRGE